MVCFKQMGSITRFRRLQPSSFGMLYYLFRFVSSTHAEAKEVCHLMVSWFFAIPGLVGSPHGPYGIRQASHLRTPASVHCRLLWLDRLNDLLRSWASFHCSDPDFVHLSACGPGLVPRQLLSHGQYRPSVRSPCWWWKGSSVDERLIFHCDATWVNRIFYSSRYLIINS